LHYPLLHPVHICIIYSSNRPRLHYPLLHPVHICTLSFSNCPYIQCSNLSVSAALPPPPICPNMHIYSSNLSKSALSTSSTCPHLCYKILLLQPYQDFITSSLTRTKTETSCILI
jgi:hypothetical protein